MFDYPPPSQLARLLASETAPHSAAQALLDPSGLPPEVEGVIGQRQPGWAISADLARVLARAVASNGLRNVVELGAGSSSVVIASALAVSGGGRLTSIEEHPEWCLSQWAQVTGYADVDAEMLVARPSITLGRVGLYYRYDVSTMRLRARGPFDLVLVDGPQHFYGREGALPLLHGSLAPGALIIVDDARRAGEQRAIWRWLRSYDGLRLVLFEPTWGKKGVAILRVPGAIRPRFSAPAFATGVSRGFQRLYRNRSRESKLAGGP